MERKFSISTNLFRLAQGSSPTDKQNIETVKRVIKAVSGAENVKVGFHEGPDGSPLIDQYEITLQSPRVMADGQYVSLAKQGALDGSVAEVIGRIIKAFASNQDATADIQKLLQLAKGGGNEEGTKPEEGSATGPAKPSGGGGFPGGGGSGAGGSGGGGFPGAKSAPGGGGGADLGKPKTSFASKQGNLKKAMLLESVLKIPMGAGMKIARQYDNKPDFESFVVRVAGVKEHIGLNNRDAFDIVNLVDSSRDWASYYKKASQFLTDENDKPFSAREYAHIAKVARGEVDPLA